MRNLFTVLVSFEDHLVGVQQVEAVSPMEALKESLNTSEAFEGYDREVLIKSITPFIHYADNKGVWGFGFDQSANVSGEEGNPVLGGNVVQTDINAPARPKDN